jgi:hypothetical protein
MLRSCGSATTAAFARRACSRLYVAGYSFGRIGEESFSGSTPPNTSSA